MTMYVSAFFTTNGVPAAGLTPTLRIRRLDTNALAVTDAAMTEVGDGAYRYEFATHDPLLDYLVRCDGGVAQPVGERYTEGAISTSDALDATAMSTAHGSGAWGVIGSSGLYSITMTVRDAVTLNPLVDALVVVKNSTGVTVINVSRTSSAGVTIPALDAGTYTVLIGMTPGYTSLTATLVVTANAAVTYGVQPVNIGVSGTPGLCLVYGYVDDGRGNLVDGRKVHITLINTPRVTTNRILERAEIVVVSGAESVTGAGDGIPGLWRVLLVIGETYNFLIGEADINKRLVIPNEASYDFREAIYLELH